MTQNNRLLPVIRSDDTTLLEWSHQRLAQQYKTLIAQVDAFDRACRNELNDLMRYHQRLQAAMQEVEAERLRAAAAARQQAADQAAQTAQDGPQAAQTPSPDPSPAPEAAAPDAAPDAVQREAEAVRFDKQCAKFFKKIARRCHPDKTRDTALHDVFIRARHAYERHDLPLLKQLYDLLLRGGRLSLQKDTRAELEAKIRDLHWQIACLVHSDVYTMTLIWQTNDRYALHQMAQQILAQVERLRMQLYLLTGQFF